MLKVLVPMSVDPIGLQMPGTADILFISDFTARRSS
jgi:hypothetical protein